MPSCLRGLEGDPGFDVAKERNHHPTQSRTRRAAVNYCLEVWKYFKVAPPDLQLILNALDAVAVTKAPPSWVAYAISIGVGAKTRLSPASQIEPRMATRIEQSIPAHTRSQIRKAYGLQKTSVLDRERVRAEDLVVKEKDDFVIAEVKSSKCSVNPAWLNKDYQNVQYSIKWMGVPER